MRYDDSLELLPPFGNDGVGPKVMTLLAECIADKETRGKHKQWIDAYKFKHNEPFSSQGDSRQARCTVNMFHRILRTMVNRLTDGAPTFEVAPMEHVDEQERESLTAIYRLLTDWWRGTKQQPKYRAVVDRGATYGKGICKVLFDPDAAQGRGQVDTVVVNPFHFAVYPPAAPEIQKSEAVFHFYPMSVREARRRWPHMAEHITADGDAAKRFANFFNDVLGAGRREEAVYGNLRLFHEMFYGGATGDVDDQTLVVEAWVRDYRQDVKGDLYAGNIRRVTVCSQRLVVDDRSNPNIPGWRDEGYTGLTDEQRQRLDLWDKFPFCDGDGGGEDEQSLWSEPIFQQLKDLCTELTFSMSQLVEAKDKAVGYSKPINPKSTGIPSNHISDPRKRVLEPRSARTAEGLGVFQGPSVPKELFDVISMAKEFILLISGTFEVEQVQHMTGRDISGVGIELLTEMEQVMLRDVAQSFTEDYLVDLGKMALSLMFAFYTDDRWVAYLDEDGDRQVMQVNPRQLLMPMALAVVPGSTMPQSRVAKRNEMLQLHGQGIVDDVAVLETLAIEGKNDILERKREGALGPVMERLAELLSPDQVEQVRELLQMDDREFQQAVDDGELPLLAPPQAGPVDMSGQEQQALEMSQLELEKLRAEIREKDASTRKTELETQRVAAEVARSRREVVKQEEEEQAAAVGALAAMEAAEAAEAAEATQMEGPPDARV